MSDCIWCAYKCHIASYQFALVSLFTELRLNSFEKKDLRLKSLFKVFSLPRFMCPINTLVLLPLRLSRLSPFSLSTTWTKAFLKGLHPDFMPPPRLGGIICFHGYKYHHHASDFHVSVFSQIISFKYIISKNPFNPFNEKTTKWNGDRACREQCRGLQHDFGERPGSNEGVSKIDFGNWLPMYANWENNF